MKKLALVILDGFGINTKTPKENAILQAKTNTFSKLWKAPYATIDASGKSVGVPIGQMGNSEIGHMTIGSGRIIKQSMVEIDDMLDSGKFAKLKEFKDGIEHCRKNKSNLHLLQIFGPGGVHGYDSHLKKILKIIPKDIEVNLHLFGDGRDLDPQSAYELMVEFEKYIDKFDNVKISSFSGRYFAMDRDNNRDRIQKAYDEIMFGQYQTSDTPSEYIQKSYERLVNKNFDKGIYDEFVVPVCFIEGDQIEDDDAVFVLNFRSDRARQITQAISISANEKLAKNTPNRDQNFIIKSVRNIYLATMTKYYPEYDGPVFVKHTEIKNTLGEVIAHNEGRQLHIAETEKFAHVTKFFNGGKHIVFDGEKDILVPSHKVETYDLDPSMSAREIYDEFIAKAKNFEFVVINFANGDMVGHTGVMDAAIKAVEKVDMIMNKIIGFCTANDFDLLITADHGNCEEMGTEGEPKTSHSLNPVPCWYVKSGKVQKIKEKGGLSDIAPTALKIMGIKIPKEMTGKSLV